MKKINILLLSPLPPPVGGIASWSLKYANWMNEHDFKVDVVNTGLIGKRATNPKNIRNPIFELIRYIKISTEMKKKIISIRPTLLQINTSCGFFGLIRDYYLAHQASRKKISVVVHYHCNIEDQINGRKLSISYLKKLSALAKANIVLNKKSEAYLCDYTKSKVVLLPNFIEKNNMLFVKKKIEKIISNVIYVGHISESKGILDILEAAKNLPQIVFTLIGPIYMKIDNSKVPLNVKFLGQLNNKEIYSHLDKSDLFLFPSFSEGFSMSLLEAMSRALPVIATDVGANADMIELFGGRIIKTHSPSDILKAISSLASPQARENASEWNVRKVENNYTSDIVLSELVKVYNSIL